jgi:hypothetical protein
MDDWKGGSVTPIQIAAKIQDCQDAMRSLCGDKYEDRIAPYREAIQRRMTGSKTELVAAIQLATEFKNEGHDGMAVAMTMAACGDLIAERSSKQ